MRCEIPHRCVRRKYRIRRHSPFRLRNCWEGRSVRASSLLRQLAKGGCAARRLSWVTPGFSQSRRCKTTASAKLACLQVDSRGSPVLGLAEKGVDYIYNDVNRYLIPDSVHAVVEELRRKIIQGEIRVPSSNS